MQVQALQQRETLPLPTLALNYGDRAEAETTPANLYQYGLAAEDEAVQIAEKAWTDGLRRALVMVPKGNWGERIYAAFEQRFGFPLLEAWAMTESGCGGTIIANREPRHVDSCCFGKPSAAVEYKLIDEQRREVAAGQPGELLVRARGDDPRYGFFAGYLKNPEATAEAWRDGWLNTGDVVRAGSDGSLYFVDRRKNVIRRSGENISALEVESVLVQQPAVDLAIAIAVPDELRGDEVMALIILAAGQQPSRQLAEQIVTTALQGLAYYKVPGFVAFVSELPMTASQKPRRADIKALGQQLHSSGDCFDTCALKKRQPSATAASRSPL